MASSQAGAEAHLARRIAEVALPIALAVCAVGQIAPWIPSERGSPIDSSWQAVLHHAFLNRLRFGTDIVFSFGPWGFVTEGYHPKTRILVLPIGAAIAAILAMGSWFAQRWSGGGLLRSALVTIGTTTLAAAGSPEAPFQLLVPLLLIVHFRLPEERPWLAALIAIGLGFGSLTKFSVCLAALPAVAIVGADEILTRRRFPLCASVFAVSLVIWWLLAGQRLADILPFFQQSWQLASGYSEALSSMPGRHPLEPISLLAVGGAAFLGAFAIGEMSRDRMRGIPASVAMASFLFILFKSGAVRQDANHVPEAYLAVLTTMLIAFPTGLRAAIPARALALVAIATVGGIVLHFNPRLVRLPIDTPSRIASHVFRIGSTEATNSRRWEQRQEALRKAVPLEGIHGSVDLYPDDLRPLLASRLDYRPRPVFQSYAATTARLAGLNARYLETAGPGTVLFDVAPVDGHFPSLDDGASWPALLTHYAVAGERNGYLELRRIEDLRTWQAAPMPPITTLLGSSVEIAPAAPLVWVEIDLRPSLVGRVVRFLFKPPVVTIVTRTMDGRVHRHRLVPSVARGGFLLSPLVENREMFAAVATGRPLPSQNVVRLSLEVPRGREWLFQRRFIIRPWRVEKAEGR
ncbi:MAG TPA: hypothetical protein VMT00_10215 [Thermoanaerobaculia bacterium]|nr:hypothetical protein [Thermoanaerobaculia bacterium]